MKIGPLESGMMSELQRMLPGRDQQTWAGLGDVRMNQSVFGHSDSIFSIPRFLLASIVQCGLLV